jgi:hypothetical protein
MQLTTDYREQAVGTLKGSKEYYLVGSVEFTSEERTVAQECAERLCYFLFQDGLYNQIRSRSTADTLPGSEMGSQRANTVSFICARLKARSGKSSW